MLLGGDTGGTKTNLAIFLREARPHAPLTQARVHGSNWGRRLRHRQCGGARSAADGLGEYF